MAFYLLEYLSVLKRMKMLLASIFSFVFVASVLFALNWSNYQAIATVEVARPEISVDVIEAGSGPGAITTAEAMADLQISRLKQKVLSTSSLAEIITKLDLYPEQRKSTPIAYVAEDMRKKVNVQLLSTSLANPASAQKASALQLSAIAFTLSFKYKDPLLAQKTVNELVTLFLDEDLKERRSIAKKTTEFLDGQINILSENLEEQEKKIAEFRAKNGDIRPDALAFNQQAAVTTTTRLLSVESELISNHGVIGALRSQLAQTDPYARIMDESGEVLTTPAIQLRALKSQYATLTAKYGSHHPDVVKVSRQIRALQASNKPKNAGARIKAQINDVTAKLKVAEKEYGADHPDVLSLTKQLDSLNTQLESTPQDNESALDIAGDADNPAYLQIVAQLEAAQERQSALESQKEDVKKQEEEFRKAIAQNPVAEQQMASVIRDYDNLMAMYRDLKAKKLASEMNETIEQGSIGQRLSIIEAPQVPLETSPSKKLFVLAGFMLATLSALGAVLGIQIMNQSIVGPNHLQSLLGVAPLVKIPHLQTIDEKIKIRELGIKLLTFFPIALLILIVLFFLIVMPFDVFWAMIAHKLS